MPFFLYRIDWYHSYMSYFQKPLLGLLKEGKVSGEMGQHSKPRHIETVISNVFIFDTKVYKVYKNDNDFFNASFRDISTKENRFSFSKKDFAWNNTLSPSIYTELVGVRVTNDAIEYAVPEEEAEELVIVMNRINTEDILFQRLNRKDLSRDDCHRIGKQFAESFKKIQKRLPGHNYFDLYGNRIADLRSFILLVTEYISAEESGAYCDFMDRVRLKHEDWFTSTLSEEVSTDGDFHSHNALFSNGSFYLMDTYPPKEEWGAGHPLIGLYRIGVDIWALSGEKEFFEAFIKGYEEGSGTVVDRTLEDMYIMYGGGIMVSYLYMLQRTDPDKKEAAERFHAFLRNYFQEKNLRAA